MEQAAVALNPVAAILTAAAVLTVAACSGSSGSAASTASAPHICAAADCRDFAAWYLRIEVISAPRRTPLRSRRQSARQPAGCSTRTLQRCSPMCKPRPPRGQPRTGQGGDDRGRRLYGRAALPVREPFFVIRPQRSAEEHAADLIAAAPSPERTSDQALQPSGPNRSVLSSES
jgi:hypothetical protein